MLSEKQVEEKTKDKVETAVTKGADPQKAVDIMEAIPKPDPKDPDAVAKYFDLVDKRLTELTDRVSRLEKPDTSSPPRKESKPPVEDAGAVPTGGKGSIDPVKDTSLEDDDDDESPKRKRKPQKEKRGLIYWE